MFTYSGVAPTCSGVVYKQWFGYIQWCSASMLCQVHSCSCFDQQFDCLDVRVPAGNEQRRYSIRLFEQVENGSGSYQHLHSLNVTVPSSHKQSWGTCEMDRKSFTACMHSLLRHYADTLRSADCCSIALSGCGDVNIPAFVAPLWPSASTYSIHISTELQSSRMAPH